MTVTGFVFVAAGTAALVFVGCLHAEMRNRARERDALMAAGTGAVPQHHAMPLRTDVAIAARAQVLAPVAVLIDNLTAVARGVETA